MVGDKLKKIWRGLVFMKQTNLPRSRVLMGFHHPDSITWRWSVWLNFGPKKIIWPLIFRQSSNGYGYVKIEIPFVGSLTINTQPPMWRQMVNDGICAHEWSRDGERCVKCGDKDWMT